MQQGKQDLKGLGHATISKTSEIYSAAHPCPSCFAKILLMGYIHNNNDAID